MQSAYNSGDPYLAFAQQAGAVPPSVLTDVEQRVNELLIDDLPVHAEIMSMAAARAAGARHRSAASEAPTRCRRQGR